MPALEKWWKISQGLGTATADGRTLLEIDYKKSAEQAKKLQGIFEKLGHFSVREAATQQSTSGTGQHNTDGPENGTGAERQDRRQ